MRSRDEITWPRHYIPTEYSDFADIFFPELALKLPEHTGINDHAIKLVND